MPTVSSKKTSQRTLIIISLILVLIATLSIAARQTFMLKDIAQLDSIWSLSITTTVQANENGAEVAIAPPLDTVYARVVAQHIVHPGLKLLRQSPPDQTGNRRLVLLSATNKGRYELVTDYTIQLKTEESVGNLPIKLPVTEEKRSQYLQNNVDLQLDHPIVEETVRKLSADVKNVDALADKLFQFVNKRIIVVKDIKNTDVVSTLETGRSSSLGKVRSFVALCRAANIPARYVSGFLLEENFDSRPIYWTEILLEGHWVSYDPLKGYQKEIPYNYLPMRRGSSDIVRGSENTIVKSEFDISQLIDRESYFTNKHRTPMDILNFNRLSLETRHTLAILMLLPIGALFTTLIRTLMGVKTYGTFTPALIGLAASHADWITATMIFAVVSVIGLSGRHFIHGRLLRAPRLTIVFTLVAVAMILGVSILDYLRLSSSGHVVLLPVVILTMLVDRIYTTTDEKGLQTAMIRLFWTIAIAIVCLGIVQQEWLGHLLLQYPEAQLITIALILLLSAYKGKNFLDHFPIKGLIEPATNNEPRTKQNNTVSAQPGKD